MIVQKRNIHLSKAVLFKDAFSEETVTNGIQIRTLPEGNVRIHAEGYCLFLNMGQEEFEVRITSPIYQERILHLKADGGETAEEIFLYPSGAYPVGPGSTTLCGTLPLQTKLRVHLEEQETECKLLRDYQSEDRQLSVFVRGNGNRAKRNWYIRDKERQNGEYFYGRPDAENPELFELDVPLHTAYQKKNALLYPAWECLAGQNGEVYLLFGHLKENTYVLYYSYENAGKEVCGQVQIVGGKQTKYDF